MKQIKIVSAIALTMGLAIAGSASAQSSYGGTITFTGAVSDSTCTVSGGAGTSGATGNFSVALTPVAATALSAAGDVAGPTNFSLVIGGPGQTGCVNGDIAAISFMPSSTQIDATTGALANTLSGQATNVQVQLLDDTGAPINLADPSYQATATIANNTATVPFTAQYLAVGGAATPGSVQTNVVYQLTYN